jgi:hypothetical protein
MHGKTTIKTVEYGSNCDPLVQIVDVIGYLSGKKHSTFSENKMLKIFFYPRLHNCANTHGTGQ